MNNRILELENSLVELNSEELEATTGGGFWGDIAYGVFAAAHFVCYAVKDAVQNPIRPSEYR